MAKKKIKAYLSQNGISKINNYLRYDYMNDLNNKIKMFLELLCDFGRATAEQSMFPMYDIGDVSDLIKFEIEIDQDSTGYKGLIYAFDKNKLISEWMNSGRLIQAEVSPILMAEFGSGWYADNHFNVSGVGQGTFPAQTHAEDKQGWWWVDKEGNKHHSYGIAPCQPMYHAQQRLIQIYLNVAKGVFK